MTNRMSSKERIRRMADDAAIKEEQKTEKKIKHYLARKKLQ